MILNLGLRRVDRGRSPLRAHCSGTSAVFPTAMPVPICMRFPPTRVLIGFAGNFRRLRGAPQFVDYLCFLPRN